MRSVYLFVYVLVYVCYIFGDIFWKSAALDNDSGSEAVRNALSELRSEFADMRQGRGSIELATAFGRAN